MNGILTLIDCNSFFRNLRITLSYFCFHNTFQLVKYSASVYFFSLLSARNELSQRAFTSKFFIIANEPSERRRSMARRQQNRAAQDWAIGRKILDRAEKSVT